MTSPQISIHPNREALVAQACELVQTRLQAAIADRGKATIALAGGSTPKPLYQALAQADLPWAQVSVFWGDERYVPVDHPDSNAGMAKAAWLDHVPIPAANIYLTPTHFADPAAAAAAYESTLKQVFGTDWPQFDVILLGLGDDGHTASLFPKTAALTVRDRLVTVGEKSGQPRITFTIPLINQGRCVVFLVSGQSKQTALRQVFAEEAEETTWPARSIQPAGELWWLLDAAAGAPLQGRPEVQQLGK